MAASDDGFGIAELVVAVAVVEAVVEVISSVLRFLFRRWSGVGLESLLLFSFLFWVSLGLWRVYFVVIRVC